MSVLSFASRTTTASLAITLANDWAGVAASSVNKAPAFPVTLLLRNQGVGMAAAGASRFPAPKAGIEVLPSNGIQLRRAVDRGHHRTKAGFVSSSPH